MTLLESLDPCRSLCLLLCVSLPLVVTCGSTVSCPEARTAVKLFSVQIQRSRYFAVLKVDMCSRQHKWISIFAGCVSFHCLNHLFYKKKALSLPVPDTAVSFCRYCIVTYAYPSETGQSRPKQKSLQSKNCVLLLCKNIVSIHYSLHNHMLPLL